MISFMRFPSTYKHRLRVCPHSSLSLTPTSASVSFWRRGLCRQNRLLTGPAGSLVTLLLHASILSALSSFFTGPHARQTSGHQTELPSKEKQQLLRRIQLTSNHFKNKHIQTHLESLPPFLTLPHSYFCQRQLLATRTLSPKSAADWTCRFPGDAASARLNFVGIVVFLHRTSRVPNIRPSNWTGPPRKNSNFWAVLSSIGTTLRTNTSKFIYLSLLYIYFSVDPLFPTANSSEWQEKNFIKIIFKNLPFFGRQCFNMQHVLTNQRFYQ